MGSMPFAFSVHNFISSVGADAGFAAIIGLAVLVLLYFAHARETANLREEAAILAARLQQAEARVAELSRPAPVAVPAPETVQVTDQRHVPLAPFAPAGMAAPALAAATRVVPLPAAPAPAPANGAPAAGESTEASPDEVPLAQAESAVAEPEAAQPAVAMAAAAASPEASVAAPPPPSPTAVPAPATAAGANGGGRGVPPPISAPSASTRGPSTLSASPPSRQLPPLGPPARSGTSVAGRILIGLVALALLVAVVVALLVITSSTGTRSSRSPAQRVSNAPVTTHAGAFSPASVTVSVLNGTATNQLAHRVAAKLAAAGYQKGRVATAANQTESTTIVAYLPGAKNRADALHVARALNLRSSAVQPIDPGTRQVACPPPGACTANVVVTVGADLATL